MSTQRNIRLLALHNFCIDFKPYYPIAILYFTEITGSFALGMMVQSAIRVSSAIFELPTGIFSDLIGRKKTIIIGGIFSTLSLVAYACAGSLWLLLTGAVLQGMSHAFYSGNNDALLHDSLSELEREGDFSDALGKTKSMYQLALASSAIVGGILGVWSFRAAMWASVVPQIISIIVSFFFIEPRMHSPESTNIYSHLKEALFLFFGNAKLRLISFGSILQNGFGEAIFIFEPAFIGLFWPVWGIGLARTVSHSFAWLSYWFAGRVVNKIGALFVLIASLLVVNSIGLIAYGYPTIISPALLTLGSLAYGFIIVSQSTLLQKEFSQKQRATMGSLNALFGSLFFGICSIFVGYLADIWSPAIAMFIAQIFLLSSLPLYGAVYRHQKNAG